MPYKVKPTVTIQKLSKELTKKLKLVEKLQGERTCLCDRQALLEETCTCLSLLYSSGCSSTPSENEKHLIAQLEQYGDSLTTTNLLSTPGHSSDDSTRCNSLITSSQCGSTALDHDQVSVEDPTTASVAPARHPLRWMLHLLRVHQHTAGSLQTNASGAPVTLPQMRSEYQVSINKLRALMLELQHSPSCVSVAKFQEAFVSYWSSLTRLLLAGRGDVSLDFLTSNTVTGERIEHRKLDLYKKLAAEELQLNREQRRRIVAALQFYLQLQHPVNEQRQQLQLELLHERNFTPAAEQCAAAAESAGASAAETSQCDVFRKQRALLQQQQHWLHLEFEQNRVLLQMGGVLEQEYLWSFFAYVAIEGCLTWKQLAQFALALHPHPFSPIELGKMVAAAAEFSDSH